MTMQHYDGSQFVAAPPRQWDGKASPFWEGPTMYKWNGSQWVDALLSKGLVGYWDFQPRNVNNGTVTDMSGNGNDGSISNEGAHQGCPVGQSLEFQDPGTPTEMTVPHSSSLAVTGGDFSVSALFRMQNGPSASASILHKREKSEGDTNTELGLIVSSAGYVSNNSNKSVIFFYGDGSSLYSTVAEDCPPNDYLRVTAVYRASNNDVELHIDRFKTITNSFSASPVSQGNPIVVGPKYGGSGSIDDRLIGAIGEIRIYNRALSQDEIDLLNYIDGPATGTTTATVTLQEEVLGSGLTDPCAFYDSGRSPPYRLIVTDNNNDRVDLYESSDLSSWSLVQSDLTGDSNPFQDYIVVNGTYYVYQTDSGTTRVWSGGSLTSLTDQGQVVDKEDPGVYYDGSTVYLFVEGGHITGSADGNRLDLYTASDPTGNYSFHSTALDMSDRYMGTGDPDIEQINGTYWLFTDSHHPSGGGYNTLLAKSDDLIDWQIVDRSVKSEIGGDLELIETDQGWVGFTEFTGGDRRGIGRWDFSTVTV